MSYFYSPGLSFDQVYPEGPSHEDFNFGLIVGRVIKQPDGGILVTPLHFCGFRREPTTADKYELVDQLANDEAFGMTQYFVKDEHGHRESDSFMIGPATQEILDTYKSRFVLLDVSLSDALTDNTYSLPKDEVEPPDDPDCKLAMILESIGYAQAEAEREKKNQMGARLYKIGVLVTFLFPESSLDDQARFTEKINTALGTL